MRNMRFLTAIILIVLIACNTGCGKNINSPKMTLLHVINHVKKDNWEEIYKHVTPELYNLMQNLRSDIAVGVYNSKKQEKAVETINGDLAYVSVFFRNEKTPVTFYFKRHEGKWKMDVPFKREEESIALEKIIPYIEDGDFILSSEDHLWSYYIRYLSPVDKRYSHSGIINKKNSVISVISSDGIQNINKEMISGVMEKPIEEYLRNKCNIGIYRAKRNNRRTYSKKAAEYIGVPFDFKFSLDNEKELYCTQLIQVVLRETNTPIKLRLTYVKNEDGEVILPDSISRSDDFKEIIYVENDKYFKYNDSELIK